VANNAAEAVAIARALSRRSDVVDVAIHVPDQEAA
jgi:hypothetical protein